MRDLSALGARGPRAVYTLSLHDALPICIKLRRRMLPDHLVLRAPGIDRMAHAVANSDDHVAKRFQARAGRHFAARSEEHTSELQSHVNLVCRLLLEKKN